MRQTREEAHGFTRTAGVALTLLLGYQPANCTSAKDGDPTQDSGPPPGSEASAGESRVRAVDAEDRSSAVPSLELEAAARGDEPDPASDETDATNEQAPPARTAPPLLSQTGYFDLAEGRREYAPAYPLWSDGSEKTRSVYLPAPIDNADPNHWSFPVGTKFWKEFRVGGRRIETRYIERTGSGRDDYLFATYWWKPTDGSEPTDALLLGPDEAVVNANDTDHDIPNTHACHQCHGPLEEHVLGFGAIELGAGATGFTLAELVREGLLASPVPLAGYAPPGDALARGALGYLHANCGICHNESPGIAIVPPRMNLRLRVEDASAEQTGAYATAVNALVTTFLTQKSAGIDYRIEGGNSSGSAIVFRMSQRPDGGAPDPNGSPRHDTNQMPPLGTERVDTEGLAAVRAWVDSLPPPAGKGTPDGSPAPLPDP